MSEHPNDVPDRCPTCLTGMRVGTHPDYYRVNGPCPDPWHEHQHRETPYPEIVETERNGR